MMTENNRLDSAMSAFSELSQPGTDLERLVAAMPSLNGMHLTGASAQVLDAIEGFGSYYNSICKDYPPSAIRADRVDLNAEDAADLFSRLMNTIEVIRDGETERILGRLRHHHGKLPEVEIIEMRRHRDWFIPILLKEFRDEIDKFKSAKRHIQSTDGEHNSIPFFAFYLFSEWNTIESIPVILGCVKLSNDGTFELLGDSIHEQLPRYLAQFLSQDFDQIDSVICAPEVDTYVRWAAVNSYHYLVRDQNITVEDAFVRLERLFHATKLSDASGSPAAEHCYELSAAILDVLQKLGSPLQNILGDKRNLYFVESAIFPDDAEPFTEAEVQAEFHKLPPTRVSDCLECIRSWATFNRPVPKPAIDKARLNAASPFTPNITSPSLIHQPQTQSVVGTIRQAERTPRNARCPCGSGKKYKQCCLRR